MAFSGFSWETGTGARSVEPRRPLARTSAATCDNQWHLVALTVDRDQSGVLYVDGVPGNPFTNVTLRPLSLDTSTELWIGRRQPNPGGSAPVFWLGDVDEVELFKRALTGAEILSIFNAGSAGKCIP